MSLLESYNNTSKTRSFLNDFSIDELSELTVEDLQMGVIEYASTCDKSQLEKLVETLEESVYVLSESNSLSPLEESVIICISEQIKSFLKSSVKNVARGAGYLAGLPVRVAKGLAYHYGSGYARGRGTNYGARGYDDSSDDSVASTPSPRTTSSSTSGSIARGQPIYASSAAASSRTPSRGFTGNVGIRANLGRSFRMGAAAQRAGTYNQSQTQRLAQQGQRITSSMAGRAPAPNLGPRSRVTVGGSNLPRVGPRPTVTVSGQPRPTTSSSQPPATVTRGRVNTPNTRTSNIRGTTVVTPTRAPSITARTTNLRRNRPTVTQSLEEYINVSLSVIEYLYECDIVDSIESGLIFLEELDNYEMAALTEELLVE